MKSQKLFYGLFAALLVVTGSAIAQTVTDGLYQVGVLKGDNLWTFTGLVCEDPTKWKEIKAVNPGLPAATGNTGHEHVLLNERKFKTLFVPADCDVSRKHFDGRYMLAPAYEMPELEHGYYDDDTTDRYSSWNSVDDIGLVRAQEGEIAALQKENDSWRAAYDTLRKDSDELAKYPQWLGSAFFALLFLAATGLLLAWFLSARERARLRAMKEEEAIRARDHERHLALVRAQQEANHVVVAIVYDGDGRPTSYDARGPGAQVPTNWYGLDGKPIMVVHRPDNSE